jgi:PAS domain S-box-containing protein
MLSTIRGEWGNLIRVLHVDDDRALLELVKHFLEQSGDLFVDSAISGDEALKLLTGQVYDAIISDYEMPGCNGIDLLRHIRKTDPRIPFLLFSDQWREEVVIDALTSGADFFLAKGVQIRSQLLQLEHAVRESVLRRRAEREHDRISSVLRIKEAAVRSSLCPLALCDREGRIQYANPASLAIWGYTDEHEVIGKYAADFVVSPDVTPAAISGFLQERTWTGQATARRKDGSTFDARVHISTMEDESGTPLGFVASFTDLSRQKHARKQLESYIRDIRFVSEKAIDLGNYPPDGDIFGFIADSLAHLVHPGAIVIISSVRADTTSRLEAVRGAEAYLAENREGDRPASPRTDVIFEQR